MEFSRGGSNGLSGMAEHLIDSLREEIVDHDQLDLLTSFMNAAGNDTRMRILYLLWRNEEVRVNDLASILDVTTPAVSQQLKKLKGSDLVLTRRDAQTVYYRLNTDSVYIHHLLELFHDLSEALPA